MNAMELEAGQNLLALSKNPYPGRGIVLGIDETGENFVQIYWLMGRSPKSQNRVLVDRGNGTVAVEAADPKLMKGEDTSLILYNAMGMGPCDDHNVSNGKQTDALTGNGESLSDILYEWIYEPDRPNFTARISGCQWQDTQGAELSVIRKGFGEDCIRTHFEYETIPPGFGYCIHTYAGNGDPLPSFRGEPLLLPIGNGEIQSIEQIAQTYWEMLNPQNRIAIAIKQIRIIDSGRYKIHIINKHQSISQVA